MDRQRQKKDVALIAEADQMGGTLMRFCDCRYTFRFVSFRYNYL